MTKLLALSSFLLLPTTLSQIPRSKRASLPMIFKVMFMVQISRNAVTPELIEMFHGLHTILTNMVMGLVVYR